MDKELATLTKKGTFELMPLPTGKCAIGCRWVFKIKVDQNGELRLHKARLVAKGYSQQHGVDYTETYAPVVKFKSLRLLVALAAKEGFECFQDDVEAAFLNGELHEEVWMDEPPGYETGRGKWLLKRPLYGLKQAPLQWNARLDAYLKSIGFTPSSADACIYSGMIGPEKVMLGVYVDDIVTVARNVEIANKLRAIKSEFAMSEGCQLSWCLGMHFERRKDGSYDIDQSLYLKRKLDEFAEFIGPGFQGMPLRPNFLQDLESAEKSPSVEPDFPYRAIVGSLMYAAIGTRPDIAAAVSIVSRYLHAPKAAHCDLVRGICKYLRANWRGLHYEANKDFTLIGYVDASYANDEKYASISGNAFLLGNSLISWMWQKQQTAALSSAEAEYVALTPAVQETLWQKEFLANLGYPQQTVVLHEDNLSCIALSKNPQNHQKTRHIQTKYHWIRDNQKEKEFKLQYCPTRSQFADIFTKGVNGPTLCKTLDALGVLRLHVSATGGDLIF